MKAKKNVRFGILVVMVVAAALTRLLPHPPNFTPIGAMALFGAAYFIRKPLAVIVPLLALWISDLLLNNIVYGVYYDGFVWLGMPMVYAAFIIIAMIGFVLLRKIKLVNLLAASLIASVLFFLMTNFSAWQITPTYPKTMEGLLTAYIAGLPFFLNTLMGDLFFVGLLFGGFEWLKLKYPKAVIA